MYLVSVAIDQLITRIAVMDMKNNFVTDIEKIELDLATDLKPLQVITDKIEEVIKNSGIAKNKILGIGIGMPGFVDAEKGINYTFFNMGDHSIAQHISETIGIPAKIDNDSSLTALAELRFGKAMHKKNALVINIGWGIGLGLILNGQLFRGSNGFAGEFSHIPLFTNDKLCSCGKSGCLETETSLLTIIQKTRDGLNSKRLTKLNASIFEHSELAIDAIMKAAQSGDRFAIELFSEAGYNIGRGAAILIHILNPETVILSGRGSSAGKVLMAPIQQALNEYSIPRLSHNTSIEVSAIGYIAELIGAAALVMENFEKEPRAVHAATLEKALS